MTWPERGLISVLEPTVQISTSASYTNNNIVELKKSEEMYDI